MSIITTTTPTSSTSLRQNDYGKAEILEQIKSFIKGRYYPSNHLRCVGTSNDPNLSLFTEQEVSKLNDVWITRYCRTEGEAKEVMEALVKEKFIPVSTANGHWVFCYLFDRITRKQ